MAAKGTLPALFVRHPGHAPEALATPGTQDVAGTYVHAGYASEFTEGATAEHEDTGLFSSYDLVSSSLMGLTYNWGLTYKAVDDVLLKWACNLPNGVGTMAQTKTFLYSQKINTVENFRVIKGCLPQSCAVRVTRPSIAVTLNGRASVINDFNASSGLTTVATQTSALTTEPTSQPWTGKDTTTGTTSPLTVNSVLMPCLEFNFNVNWTLAELTPLGLITYQEIGPSARRITFEFTTYRKGDTFLADLNSYTPINVDMKLHNASPLLIAHFVECFKVSYAPIGQTVGAGDYTGERVGMIAMNMNIANT